MSTAQTEVKRPTNVSVNGRVCIRNVLNTGSPLQHRYSYQEEGEETEEVGGYEAWKQEQLERRVRVAQTCARSTFLPKLTF